MSIDNYSSGTKKNHINNKRVKYIKGDTKDINFLKKIKKYKSSFSFREFARIYQSFLQMDKCIDSNSIEQMQFLICLINKIKLIYSDICIFSNRRKR